MRGIIGDLRKLLQPPGGGGVMDDGGSGGSEGEDSVSGYILSVD